MWNRVVQKSLCFCDRKLLHTSPKSFGPIAALLKGPLHSPCVFWKRLSFIICLFESPSKGSNNEIQLKACRGISFIKGSFHQLG